MFNLFKCSHKTQFRIEVRNHSMGGTIVDTGIICQRCKKITDKKQVELKGLWTWQGVKYKSLHQNILVV